MGSTRQLLLRLATASALALAHAPWLVAILLAIALVLTTVVSRLPGLDPGSVA